jgi:hypothetical protein
MGLAPLNNPFFIWVLKENFGKMCIFNLQNLPGIPRAFDYPVL